MDTHTSSDRGLVDVAVVLLGLQAAIGVASTLEATFSAAFLGPTAAGPMILSAAAALATATTAVYLGRRRRWARRCALVIEGAVLAVALLDVLALPLLTGSGLALVAFLAHVVTPIVVIALLRRPPVRAAFVEVPA